MVQRIGLHVPLRSRRCGATCRATKVRELRDLRLRIVEAVGNMTPDMLQRTWAALDYRLDTLHVTNGAHIEMYWFLN
jgi:hypothetical protein